MAARGIPKQVQDSLAIERGITRFAQLALLLGVFTVSIGYGVLLPVLPVLVQNLASATDAMAAARHTGLLTGLYAFSLFLFAPIWGRLSDRYGRRPFLLVGLLGFAASTLTFAFLRDLSLLYVERFLSGLFAAAVTPIASAMIGDAAPDDQWRARRLAWLSMAGIAGLFVGPMLGGFATRLTIDGTGLVALDVIFLGGPFIITSIVSVLAASAVYASMPTAAPKPPAKQGDAERRTANGQAIQLIFALTFIVAAAVGVFEVGLALRTIQTLKMDATDLALMFSECSIVMFVAQAIVFSPLVRPDTTRRLLAPAFAAMAAGVALVGGASDFTILLVGVGAIAAGGGIVFPVLTYWLSLAAGRAQGAELGKQAAAANLGQAIGSGAGGLLFEISFLPSASFMGMTVLLSFGALISLVAAQRLNRLRSPSTAPALQLGNAPAVWKRP